MTLALKLPLAPLLVAQALYARWRVPRLPEAAGPREGVVGSGAPIALWIIGDSSAAGVGVANQGDALAGALAPILASEAGAAVRWRLFARSGINSAQALDLLAESARDATADVAVVVTGVNDVVDRVAPPAAVAARARIVAVLRSRHRVRHVVFTPVPPMHRFGGLPQPLRWIAGLDAAAHQRALAAWAQGRPGVTCPDDPLPLDDPALLARDGFHPAAPLYRRWGRTLGTHIARDVWPSLAVPDEITERRSP
jgi:lysophospholipase L1-like esterase